MTAARDDDVLAERGEGEFLERFSTAVVGDEHQGRPGDAREHPQRLPSNGGRPQQLGDVDPGGEVARCSCAGRSVGVELGAAGGGDRLPELAVLRRTQWIHCPRLPLERGATLVGDRMDRDDLAAGAGITSPPGIHFPALNRYMNERVAIRGGFADRDHVVLSRRDCTKPPSRRAAASDRQHEEDTSHPGESRRELTASSKPRRSTGTPVACRSECANRSTPGNSSAPRGGRAGWCRCPPEARCQPSASPIASRRCDGRRACRTSHRSIGRSDLRARPTGGRSGSRRPRRSPWSARGSPSTRPAAAPAKGVPALPAPPMRPGEASDRGDPQLVTEPGSGSASNRPSPEGASPPRRGRGRSSVLPRITRRSASPKPSSSRR